MSALDPTIAERSRRYRRRRRATARSPLGATVRTRLTARQEAAIDVLIEVIAETDERPAPDGPIANRLCCSRRGAPRYGPVAGAQGLIDLGVVIEHGGHVAVGDFMIEIEVAR